jgi:hypothetical protein
MDNVIVSTKDFTVGDIFITRENTICYLANIYQSKKGAHYEYQMIYLTDNTPYYARPKMNVSSIKDKMRYYGWKHVPVVKNEVSSW